MHRALVAAIVGCAALVRVASADPSPGHQAAEAARLSAVAVCNAHEPSCDWLATLAKLERETLVRGLAERHLTLDPMPWGKTIARVEVYNEKVFAEGGSVIEFFNHFHVVTREGRIAAELTIGAGEVWDQLRVDESARRLHDPLYSSVVAAVPVISDEPGKVILFVVTRDIFSLRLNTNYIYQNGDLTNLTASMSENNFLGTRNFVSFGIVMDEGSIAVGPSFLDKNLELAGIEHLTLNVQGGDILTRQALPVVAAGGSNAGTLLPPPTGDPLGVEDGHDFHSEGSYSSISLTRPLWALATEWAGGVSFSHNFGVARNYSSTNDGVGLLADYPAQPLLDNIAEEYEIHRINTLENVTRQWGTYLKQQLTFGHFIAYQAPFLLPSFPTDNPTVRADFAADIMPPRQTDSALYAEYSFFEPRYTTWRHVQTYDLAEDQQFGASLDTSIQVGPELLGSTHNFVRPSLSIGYTLPWARDGSVHAGAAISMRRQTGTYVDSNYIDNTASYTVRITTPSNRYGRIVLQQSLFTRWHDTQNAVLSLGSDSGLRGYDVAELYVDGSGRILLGQVEARSTPIAVWVLRLGATVFYELGGVTNTLQNLAVFDDVGFGVRALIPQTSRLLFRFDFAVPLRTDPIPGGTVAGQLHFIAGFDSYF